MWSTVLQSAFLALYAAVLGVMAVYGVHRYHLVYLYRKHRRTVHEPTGAFAEPPVVTVQLPMYNEERVAERVIAAACAIDWPLDRLEIQVLDDSTGESADIARAACERWAARGYPVVYLHRDDRTGYKAGALAAGLKVARGEFVAIFDADFVPPPDILRDVLPHFTDPAIGLAQVRWEHLNRDANWLTRGQAIFLDGHFVIEHAARNRSGRFMHFNGTAGVWRRTTIDEAGGWQHDTLTEDLDLSYRAQLKGWKFLYLPQFAAPAELPPEIIAFKQQAHRWTKGSCQTAIKLLGRVLRSPGLGWRVKAEAFFHLTCTVAYPLVVLLTVMLFPAYLMAHALMDGRTLTNATLGLGLFILATCSAGTFFVYAQRELFGPREGWRSVLFLPFVMALGVGVSLNNTKAVLEAVFGDRRGRNEFVRTPKYGVTGGQAWRGRSAERSRFDWSKALDQLVLPVLEVAFGLYLAATIAFCLAYDFALMAVPFLTLFAAGYLYVGTTSMWVLWRMHRPAGRREDVPSKAVASPIAA